MVHDVVLAAERLGGRNAAKAIRKKFRYPKGLRKHIRAKKNASRKRAIEDYVAELNEFDRRPR